MLTTEVVYRHLNKHGEELCGDRVEVRKNVNQDLVVMSDGLGSGVKANILSSLTTRIIATMLREGCTLHEVADTLNQTLPVCKVRNIAYSTFTALKVDPTGRVEAAEYDNPDLMWFSGNKLQYIPRKEIHFSERMKIKQSSFALKENDFLVAISDGVVHAGIGKSWNLGWSWDRVARYLKTSITPHITANQLCDTLVEVVDKLYAGQPGDDATVVVVHYRRNREAAVMIGPPSDPLIDTQVVETLMATPGKKIVCGGTTGNIVSRYLNKEIDVLLHTATPTVPAIGKLEGVDLITEGVLTLAEVVAMLRKNLNPKDKDLKYRNDGAALMYNELLQADRIKILLGRAINPAHQNPKTPIHLGLKFHLIKELEYMLTEIGKQVTLISN
jgi:Stage II sporulation protein E (SpoIIE)